MQTENNNIIRGIPLYEGVGGAFDMYVSYKFIRELVKSWTDTEAYRLGIIDANGVVLKKRADLTTQEEKDSFTVFHRLVWNIKRLMEKLPGGKSKLVSFATAAWLLKENSEDIQKSITAFLVEEGEPVNVTGDAIAMRDPLLFKKPLKKTKKKKDMANTEDKKEESAVIRLNHLLMAMRESKRIVKVVRQNIMMRKTKCSPGQKVVDGKCLTQTSGDKLIQRKASRKRERTMAGKSKAVIIRKRQKSVRKRTSLGL